MRSEADKTMIEFSKAATSFCLCLSCFECRSSQLRRQHSNQRWEGEPTHWQGEQHGKRGSTPFSVGFRNRNRTKLAHKPATKQKQKKEWICWIGTGNHHKPANKPNRPYVIGVRYHVAFLSSFHKPRTRWIYCLSSARRRYFVFFSVKPNPKK